MQIAYPDEPITGGDIDFHFLNARSAKEWIIRVQAKRLNQEQVGTRNNKFQNRMYAELLHKVKKTGKYQFRTLIADPEIVPLYAFYNHASVVRKARQESIQPEIAGVNLAFAQRIAPSLKELVAGLAGRPKRVPHNKRMMHLKAWFFGLDALFCSHGSNDPVPTPEAVAENLRAKWLSLGGVEDHPVVRKLSLDISAQTVDVLEFVRQPLQLVQGLARPVVRFVSGIEQEATVRSPQVSRLSGEHSVGLPTHCETERRLAADPGFKFDGGGGNCPVWRFSIVDGFDAIFYARGTHWEFQVAPAGEHMPTQNPLFELKSYYGPWPEAANMPMTSAMKYLELAVGVFRSTGAGMR
nr:DUF6615 family protein [Sphingomonas cavernae]